MGGTKSTAIVSFVTVPLPYVLVLILLIRGVTLEGAGTGIIYYLKPDFSHLLRPELWISAAGQVFFSLGVACGVMTAFGSYNTKNQDMVVDSTIVSVSNSSFSFYAGFAVFSMLGHLSHKKNVPVAAVMIGSLGLGFITYPQAVALLPLSHVFAILLFINMFLLGLDSAFALTEAVVSVVHDIFPHTKQIIITIGVCICGFVCGLPFCLDNGIYLLDSIDHYVSDYCLVIIALAECIVIGYFAATDYLMPKLKQTLASSTNILKKTVLLAKILLYHSVDEFRLRISKRSRIGLLPIYNVFIKITSPLILGALLIYAAISESNIIGQGNYSWPSIVIGVMTVVNCLFLMAFLAIFPIGAPKPGEPVPLGDDDEEQVAPKNQVEMLPANSSTELTGQPPSAEPVSIDQPFTNTQQELEERKATGLNV